MGPRALRGGGCGRARVGGSVKKTVFEHPPDLDVNPFSVPLPFSMPTENALFFNFPFANTCILSSPLAMTSLIRLLRNDFKRDSKYMLSRIEVFPLAFGP